MSLDSITIQHFRNISQAEIHFDPGINLIFGENGSGKTSILEAIQYLSSGKSFRTRKIAPLIQQDSDALTIAAYVHDDTVRHRIGIRRSPNRLIRRIDNSHSISQADFSRLLPVRILHPDSHLLISSSPGLRRRYLDWGCFYFNEHFYFHWQAVQSLLKQRNAALKQSLSSQVIDAIDQQLIPHSESVHTIRTDYLEKLLPEAQKLAQTLIRECNILDVSYLKGWNAEEQLQSVLESAINNDRRFKRTQYGVHRADFNVFMNGNDVRSTASRGQQKLIAFVLILAQLILYANQHHKSALLMIDDLASELDSDHQNAFLRIIQEFNHQVIMTAISKNLIDLSGWNQDGKMFHVKHGEIQEVI